jgi:hypothetical protein
MLIAYNKIGISLKWICRIELLWEQWNIYRTGKFGFLTLYQVVPGCTSLQTTYTTIFHDLRTKTMLDLQKKIPRSKRAYSSQSSFGLIILSQVFLSLPRPKPSDMFSCWLIFRTIFFFWTRISKCLWLSLKDWKSGNLQNIFCNLFILCRAKFDHPILLNMWKA